MFSVCVREKKKKLESVPKFQSCFNNLNLFSFPIPFPITVPEGQRINKHWNIFFVCNVYTTQ